ncbi:class I SAM-dependent methyltransferase [Spiribacter roseus]|uniref:class I SAM-dependent methyltransferase n=1 Tax=Spiribacter roseus TaxID=1855875 RepID=UPI0011D03740
MTDASLFYRRFEDRYRGSRELILERLRGYTPYLKVLKRRHGKAAQALDLGCGRGEWLEVLGEVGLEGRGVDLDAGMLSACEERGFNAEYGDAIAALRSCEEGSLALVSGFHIAEHLEFDVLRELIAEAYRALAKGGMLILETPNPENLRVTAVDFYMDPTHQNPLPPRLLAFAVEFYGFDPCHILRLQEPVVAHDAHFPSTSEIYNCASPDFAVIAGKGWSATMRKRIGAAADKHAGVTAEALMDRHDVAQHHQQERIDGLLEEAHSDRERLDQQLAALHSDRERIDWRIDGLLEEAHSDRERVDQQLAALHSDRERIDWRIDGLLEEAHSDRERVDQQLATFRDAVRQEAENDRHQLLALVEDTAELSERFAVLDERLNELYDSRSWKITAPLRAVFGFAREVRAGLAILPRRTARRLLYSHRLRSFLVKHPRTYRVLSRLVRALGIHRCIWALAAEPSDKGAAHSSEASVSFSQAPDSPAHDTPGLPRHAQHVHRRLKRKFE